VVWRTRHCTNYQVGKYRRAVEWFFLSFALEVVLVVGNARDAWYFASEKGARSGERMMAYARRHSSVIRDKPTGEEKNRGRCSSHMSYPQQPPGSQLCHTQRCNDCTTRRNGGGVGGGYSTCGAASERRGLHEMSSTAVLDDHRPNCYVSASLFLPSGGKCVQGVAAGTRHRRGERRHGRAWPWQAGGTAQRYTEGSVTDRRMRRWCVCGSGQ